MRSHHQQALRQHRVVAEGIPADAARPRRLARNKPIEMQRNLEFDDAGDARQVDADELCRQGHERLAVRGWGRHI